MDPDPQWRGKGSSHSSHPMRHNLMSPQDHSETCSVSDTCSLGSAGCRLSFQQELQTGFLFSLPHSSFASQLLQTSCLLHFLKLALTAKNRIWSQRRTSPSFFIDSQVREQKQLWSWISASSGATQSWLPSERRD